MKTNFVELVLTCSSWQEAQKIADQLLEQKLVACVEFMEIKSRYWWQKHIEQADEVKLIMESVADNYDKVEQAVKKLHSYDTFVLQMLPIEKLNQDAAAWLERETTQE